MRLPEQTTWLKNTRYDYIPDFITEDERLEFKAWFDDSLENDINLVNGMTANCDGSEAKIIDFRKTTRLNDANLVIFPSIAYVVFERIQAHYDTYSIGHKGRDGMIAVATFPGGDTYKHTDPGSEVTFNIVIQAAEKGAILFIKGQPVKPEEKALHGYWACRHRHNVSAVEGSRTRYLWVFRLNLPEDEWEPNEQ